jgi:putative transposase
MAIAVRGGSVAGVIFHTDYAEVCVKPRICGAGLHSWGVLADFSA